MSLYGRLGVQALQIEVNRALYLDEERVEKLAAFEGIRARLDRALAQLLVYGAQNTSLAAE